MTSQLVLEPRNGLPSREEEKRIRLFISKQSEYIDGLEKRVADAKLEAEQCTNSIHELRTAIVGGRSMLNSFSTVISPLLEALNNAKASKIVEEKADIEGQSNLQGEGLCSYYSIVSSLAEQKTTFIDILKTSISSLQHEEELMKFRLMKLEVELQGWTLSFDQSTTHLTHCIKSLEYAMADQSRAKVSLKSHWKVPVEIWREIFRLVLYGSLAHFLGGQTGALFRPATLDIAGVCRSWRTIVLGDQAMFSNIPCFASPFSTPAEKYLLDLFLHRAGRPFTMVVNGSQEPTTEEEDEGVIAIDEIPGKYTYSVIVNVGNIDPSWAELLNEMPYSSPRELTLINNSDHLDGDIFDFISSFASESLQRLIIRDPLPQFFDETVDISSQLSSLTYLSFEVDGFSDAFDFTSLLRPQLVELHIRHTKDTIIPPPNDRVQLPHLRVLGVTPPSTEFVSCLGLPQVEKLVLYGTKVSRNPQTPPASAVGGLYGRIDELAFHHWEAIDGTERLPTVMGVLKKLKGTCRRLARVSLFNSWIDGSALKEIVAKDRRKFATLTIDQCTGFTQTDCIELDALVDKLIVIV
ncbi:hypothetical protein FRC17_002802 [Serendipita sp. 399]|nr:hypothetical protein FRC17_002802 [Serendipita sp. 399]